MSRRKDRSVTVFMSDNVSDKSARGKQGRRGGCAYDAVNGAVLERTRYILRKGPCDGRFHLSSPWSGPQALSQRIICWLRMVVPIEHVGVVEAGKRRRDPRVAVGKTPHHEGPAAHYSEAGV